MSRADAAGEQSIGSLCDFSSGHGFGPSDWSDKGLPIIRIQNLNGGSDYNYYSGEVDPRWLVEPGDLLFAWAGTKGVSFGPAVWRGRTGVLNQHIYKVHPRAGIEKQWLHAALALVTREVERRSHGFKSTLVHVHKQDITERTVFTPPTSVQRDIAVVLNAWDDAISFAEKLVALKRKRLEWVFDVSFSSRDWQLVSFGDLLSESRIEAIGEAADPKITVRLYGQGAVKKKEKRRGSGATQYYVRQVGQLVYSKLDFLNGAFALIPPELDGHCTTQDLPAFDIADRVRADWLINYVARPSYYERQTSLARGQRIARRISPKDFLSSKLPLPPLSIQDATVERVRTFQNDVEIANALFDSLRAQKRGLTQKLLTGEWRLSQTADSFVPTEETIQPVEVTS